MSLAVELYPLYDLGWRKVVIIWFGICFFYKVFVTAIGLSPVNKAMLKFTHTSMLTSLGLLTFQALLMSVGLGFYCIMKIYNMNEEHCKSFLI